MAPHEHLSEAEWRLVPAAVLNRYSELEWTWWRCTRCDHVWAERSSTGERRTLGRIDRAAGTWTSAAP
jgi:hypothetical protein